MTTAARILIAEDCASDRMILAAMLESQGYSTCQAGNGFEAISVYLKEKPDLILMDALMPEMDGFEAARRIKDLAGDVFLPIIFLTSLQDADALARSIEAGGDDFLAKPYNPFMLKAKVGSFLRMREMNVTLRQQRDQIADMNLHLMQEQEIAKKVFDKVAHAGCLDLPNIRHMITPVSVFNGDLMLAGRGPSGNLMVLLGDFTGHGLNAAIGAMPMAQTFYTMLEKGFSVQSIVREINAKLHAILPVGVFCCAVVADLDFYSRVIRVWHGGLPDCVIWRHGDRSLEMLRSRHVPLGIQPEHSFDDSIQSYHVQPGDKLFLWSDGIIEAQNAEGEMFGEQRIFSLLRADIPGEQLFERLSGDFRQFICAGKVVDDMSLIEVTFIESQLERDRQQESLPQPRAGAADWTLSYELRPDSLRDFSPLPILLHVIMQMPQMQPSRAQLYTILSELLANALEHGVLGLDSAIKSDADGFAEYYRLRTERLQQLNAGYLRATLHYQDAPGRDQGCLFIEVEDSGDGFDAEAFLQQASSDHRFSGRGIMLLRSICESVNYLDKGNRVQVVYRP